MRFLTVNRDNPCMICGRFDWCAITEDGKFQMCRRIDSGGKEKIDSNSMGRYSRPREVIQMSEPLPAWLVGPGDCESCQESLDVYDQLPTKCYHCGANRTAEMWAEYFGKEHERDADGK